MYKMLVDYNNNYTVHLDYMLFHMRARNYNNVIDGYTYKVVPVNNNMMSCLLIDLPTDNAELMMKDENRLDNKLAVVEWDVLEWLMMCLEGIRDIRFFNTVLLTFTTF